LLEFQEAYDEYASGKLIGKGENREVSCPGYINNGAYDLFKSVGVEGIFIGHDHINYSDIIYKRDGESDFDSTILSYALKSTDLVYHDIDLIGYKTITINADKKLSLDDIGVKFYGY
jgi:hypothetical protein